MQVPLYAINQHLVVDKLKALDVGGSITIHAFGAYYGLSASMVLSIAGSGMDHHKNGASYTSDMTAMVGTIFLWLFWVSISSLYFPCPFPCEFSLSVGFQASLASHEHGFGIADTQHAPAVVS